jgi:hypothetical protein
MRPHECEPEAGRGLSINTWVEVRETTIVVLAQKGVGELFLEDSVRYHAFSEPAFGLHFKIPHFLHLQYDYRE